MTRIDIAAIERANVSYRDQDLLLRRLHVARRGLATSRKIKWARGFHYKIAKHLRREQRRQECCA